MPPRRIVPAIIHRAISGILVLAAGHKELQNLFVERIADLQEPIRVLPGGEILQRFMEKLPEPGNDEQWQQFIASLTPEQAAALQQFSNSPLQVGNDWESYVNSACSIAARETIKAEIDTLNASSRNPDLSPEERQNIGCRILELRRLLNESHD